MKKNLVRKHLENEISCLSHMVANAEEEYSKALEADSKLTSDFSTSMYRDYCRYVLEKYQYALFELRTVLEILDIEEIKDS